jgi:serine/threonine protein kinase
LDYHRFEEQKHGPRDYEMRPVKETTLEELETAPREEDESVILEVPTQLDHYKVGKVLGKGAYGKVHLGLHKLANMFVAMKSMSKKKLKEGKNNNKQKVDNEVALLK